MRDNLQHNFKFGLAHESLWGLAYGMTSPFVILPLALKDLGGSAAMGGWLAALLAASSGLTQAWSATRLDPRWSDPGPCARLHTGPVLCTAAMGLLFLLGGSRLPHGLLLAGMLAGFSAFWALLGVVVPQWLACVARCIPPASRGRYFGSMYFAGALAGVAGGLLAAFLADRGGLAWGYGAAFAGAALAQAVSAWLLRFYRADGPRPHPSTEGPLHALAGLLARARGDRALRRVLALLTLMTLASASYALYTLAFRERGVPVSWFQLFAPAFSAGTMLGSLALGWLSDARGKRLAALAAIACLLASLAVAALPLPTAALVAAFLGAGFYQSAFSVLNNLLLLALGHGKAPARAAALANTLLVPVIALAPVLMGHTAGAFGYGWAFGLAALFCLAGVALTLRSPELDKEAV